MAEDRIHRRIQKLQLFLESMQEELQSLSEELNNVTIHRGRQISSLTQQFSMLNSPSEPSPNPRQQKRRSRKETPEFRRVYEVNDDNRTDTPEHMRVPSAQVEQRRRIQPTLIPRQQEPGNLELHRSYAIGGDWKQKEEEWKKKRLETLQNQQPLESLGLKSYREVTTDEEFEIDEEEEFFLPSFKFKSKGNSKENTKGWIKRMYNDGILKGINPLLNKKDGIEVILSKLQRVKKGFANTITKKEIIDAQNHFSALRNLFKQLVNFIDKDKDKKTSNLKV